MAAQYHFLSEYRLTGAPESIWAALTDVPSWPGWWSWLKRVDVRREASGEDGLGAIYRNTVRAPTGYGFVYDTEITDIERLRRIDLTSSGDIAGRGRFLLEPTADGALDLSFAWLVETPKRWMTAIAPIARPLFTWNHDRMMGAFGTGLAGAAGVGIQQTRNSSLSPGAQGFWIMPESVVSPR
jgi:uncharacterized protein YndB with AHSA1/START domain